MSLYKATFYNIFISARPVIILHLFYYIGHEVEVYVYNNIVNRM